MILTKTHHLHFRNEIGYTSVGIGARTTYGNSLITTTTKSNSRRYICTCCHSIVRVTKTVNIKRKQIAGFKDGYARYMQREISKAQLAKEFKISRPTLDKLIAEYEINSNN